MWVQPRNVEQRLRDLRAGGWLGLGTLSLIDPGGALDPKSVDGNVVRTGPSAIGAPRDPNLYAMGSGEIVGVSDTRNSRGHDIETGGITIGMDRRLGEHFAVGLALGYVDSRPDLNGARRVDVNGGMATIYGTWYDRGCYVNAAVGGGYNSEAVESLCEFGAGSDGSRGEIDHGDLVLAVAAVEHGGELSARAQGNIDGEVANWDLLADRAKAPLIW